MDFSIIFGSLPGINKKELVEDYTKKFYEIPEYNTIIGYGKYEKNEQIYGLQVWEVDFDDKNEERIKMISKICSGCIILSDVEDSDSSDNRNKILKWKDMIKNEAESVQRKIPFIFLEREWDRNSYLQPKEVEDFEKKYGFINSKIFPDYENDVFKNAIKEIIESSEIKDEEGSDNEKEKSEFNSDNEGSDDEVSSAHGSLVINLENNKNKSDDDADSEFRDSKFISTINYYDLREKYKILKSLKMEDFIKLFESLQKENKIIYKSSEKDFYFQVGLPIYNLFGKKEEIILNFYNEIFFRDIKANTFLIRAVNKMRKQLNQLKNQKDELINEK